MPYITSERVSEIRKQLKTEFPDFKLSVCRRNYSTVCISIMKAPIQLLLAYDKEYQQVNEFYIAEHYKDAIPARDTLLRIREIANTGNRIVSPDTDYGNVPAFYLDIEIGKWDQPFELIQK